MGIDIRRCGQIGMTEEGRYIQQRNILIDKDAGEGVALSYLTEKNRKGELGFSYEMIRGYNVNNSKIGRSIELDGLAKGIGKRRTGYSLLNASIEQRNSRFLYWSI